MELTKEYFETHLEKQLKLTKEYFDKKFDKIDRGFDSQNKELKEYVRDSFGAQQTYMEERFTKVKDMLDVRDQVSVLSYDMRRVKQKLGIGK